jgi:hypothetical protein
MSANPSLILQYLLVTLDATLKDAVPNPSMHVAWTLRPIRSSRRVVVERLNESGFLQKICRFSRDAATGLTTASHVQRVLLLIK